MKWSSMPVFILKQVISVLQWNSAARRIATVDWEERQKAAKKGH